MGRRSGVRRRGAGPGTRPEVDSVVGWRLWVVAVVINSSWAKLIVGNVI
jgi:hypothetical protein